ncbi:MAG: GGDEF domain-containing protein [Oscillospiraceae bacterium]|nr:GGDEF domain-containing protein [Oscillospiraceae bacterium]
MMKYLKENALRLADLLPLVAILLCTVIVFLCCAPQKSAFSDDVTELTEGWTAADGTAYTLDDLPSGDVTVSHSLSGIDLHRKRLCFRSTDTHITAIFDDETVYTYAPGQAPILGKSYGMYIHMIPIPVDAGTVTLELHPIYGGSASIKDTAVEDAGMTIYLMVRAVRRKTIDERFLHTTVIGMTAAVIGVAIDLLRFINFPDSLFGTSLFTRVGVLIFIVLMGMHLMRERTRLAVEQGRAELMKKMAYTDGLTELANRAAFHDKEDEIRRSHTDCTVVQLDINFLKKVNDVYGHAEGDRHIITAANIIRDSFAALGTAFRTSGDEFIVIAEKGGIPEVEQALAQMEKAADAYNAETKPPVPLQIAYGYAHYTTQADMLEAAEKLADQRMYEKKRQMKAKE